MEVHLRGDHPPQLLHFPVGDPDQGEALAFRRVEELPGLTR